MKRNKFSLSNYKLMTGNQGQLIPIGHYEVLPGDTIQHATSMLVRSAPLVAPLMHPVHVKIHHWYVPYRLLWDDFEDFITGGPDGDDATVAPYFNLNGDVPAGSLHDYLGIPTEDYTGINLQVSALPLRAYSKIFNEWYRDQDLVTARAFTSASGNDATTETDLASVAWEKDYFTSARPWEQKGSAVSVPLTLDPSSLGTAATIRGAATHLILTGSPLESQVAGNTGDFQVAGVDAVFDPNGTLGLNVSDLRESMALQRYAEARARYGSRYTEYLRYLGVKSSDARLQRPEYLGGGKQTLQFSEVLQTAEGDDPVGMMRGHGIAAMKSNRYRRFFEEHGIVMSLMYIKPRTVYMQALPRSFIRRTKEDYWQQELQHIGQQEITMKEVYAPSLTVNQDLVFGYQDRYDEYRRTESSVAGEFRTTLNYWHMARDLAAPPVLNGSFVSADPTTRVYAATSAAQFYVMAMHSIQARRMVAKNATSFIY